MATTFEKIGRNVVAAKVGNELVIKIDLTKDAVPSKSGKTNVLGTTNGNKPVFSGHLGVNFYFDKD